MMIKRILNSSIKRNIKKTTEHKLNFTKLTKIKFQQENVLTESLNVETDDIAQKILSDSQLSGIHKKIFIGDKLYGEGSYVNALRSYTFAHLDDPNHYLPYIGMMRTKYQLEMYESGFEDFEKLQKIKPSLEGYYFAGMFSAKLGKVEQAAEFFDKSINFRSSEEYNKLSEEEQYFEDECWYDRIIHLYQCQAEAKYVTKQYDEALEFCQKHIEYAEKLSIPSLEIYIIQAHIYGFGLNNIEKALQIFEEIIQKYEKELNPQTKLLYRQRAKFFKKLGMMEEAEKDFEIAENMMTFQ
eukprot:gene8000-12465_t